ncbi:MAG TPA: Hsp33 family molecular chaperone HslO [Terriglobales bacterium]|nr:Hsp33 family molecular chaperone HslO [Terriglobales bacterium]
MNNYISMLSEDGYVLAMAMDSTAICEEARRIHGATPVAAAALGRTLTAASLMGGTLKVPDGSLTLRIKGDGPLGGVLAVSDALGNVRGYCNDPTVELPLNAAGKLDVASAVGREGYVSVVKDLRMKEPYVGQTPIVTGEIAEDVAAYLLKSEQTPSAVALGVLIDRDYTVKAAGGYLTQPLPGCPEEVLSRLEAAVYTADPVTDMLCEGMSPKTVLNVLLPGFNLQTLAEGERIYRCGCSALRVERALISLGREELLKLADERPETEVLCEFCRKSYLFTNSQLRALIG